MTARAPRGGAFLVAFTRQAEDDLDRLLDHLIANAEDLDGLMAATETMQELRAMAKGALSRTPLIYRRSSESALMRELVLPLRKTGYVVLFEVVNESLVSVLAVRHQREDDYH
jgi:plasmid stabilization system protein ParE